MTRSSPAAIVIGLLQAAPGLLAVTLLWSTAGRGLQGGVGFLVDLAFWTFLVLRLAALPLTWLSTRWEVSEHGVRFRRGVLVREEIDVRWEEIVSFDVSQPSLHRLLGCYALRFGLGTTQKAAVRLDAVRQPTRDRIADLARLAQGSGGPWPGPASPTTGATIAPPATGATTPPATVAASPAEHEIYRIRLRDHLMISLTYGSFVLFVPAVLSLLDQVDDWIPLPLPDPAGALRWPPLLQLTACLGLLVLSLAYGWLFTWLRYRGFRVVREGSGYRTSGGLVSSETRTVTAAQVTGLKVTQNPLMRLSGHGRVTVLTRDAGDQPMANLLFPLVRLADLPAALGPSMPVHSEVTSPTLRVSRPGRAAIVAGVLFAWSGLVAIAALLRPDVIVATGTAVTVVVALGANAAWVVAATLPDRPVCYVRRGLFWVSHLEFATSAVQVAESSQGPFGRLTRTWSVALHYYDGRVRRVRALGCSPAQRHELTALVQAGPARG